MKLIYPAIFTPCVELEGYTVSIPDLPGCVTEGRSLLQAIEMGTDAASGWILGELEDGNQFPPASEHKYIECPSGSFVNLLVLDMDSYTEKFGDKSVRRNVTLPAWLNTSANKNNINVSQVLQDALLKLSQSDHD